MNKKTLIWATAILSLVVALYVVINFNRITEDNSANNEELSAPLQENPSSEATAIPSALPSAIAANPTQASPGVIESSPSTKKPDVKEGTEIGNMAVNFTLTDLDGKKVSLSDFRGKNVYLNFFATWCPPCKGEMPDMEKFYKEYKDRNLIVLAVDLAENTNTVKSFISKNNYTFRVLLDSSSSVSDKYSITAIPVSYFINKDGIIVNSRVGALDESTMKQYIEALYK